MEDKVEVRKSNGQFGPGNKTGGRKSRTAEDDVRAIFQRCVSGKDQFDIIKKAIEKAKQGDDKSRKFIFDYLYGPPVQHSDVTSKGEALHVIFSYQGEKDG